MMVILGCILILLGWLLDIGALVTIGILVAVIGLVLLVVAHARGGKHWY